MPNQPQAVKKYTTVVIDSKGNSFEVDPEQLSGNVPYAEQIPLSADYKDKGPVADLLLTDEVEAAKDTITRVFEWATDKRGDIESTAKQVSPILREAGRVEGPMPAPLQFMVDHLVKPAVGLAVLPVKNVSDTAKDALGATFGTEPMRLSHILLSPNLATWLNSMGYNLPGRKWDFTFTEFNESPTAEHIADLALLGSAVVAGGAGVQHAASAMGPTFAAIARKLPLIYPFVGAYLGSMANRNSGKAGAMEGALSVTPPIPQVTVNTPTPEPSPPPNVTVNPPTVVVNPTITPPITGSSEAASLSTIQSMLDALIKSTLIGASRGLGDIAVRKLVDDGESSSVDTKFAHGGGASLAMTRVKPQTHKKRKKKKTMHNSTDNKDITKSRTDSPKLLKEDKEVSSPGAATQESSERKRR